MHCSTSFRNRNEHPKLLPLKKGITSFIYVANSSLTTPYSGKAYRECAIGNHGVNLRHLSSPSFTGTDKTGMALFTPQDQSCMKKSRSIYYRPIMRNQFDFELSFILLFLLRRYLSHLTYILKVEAHIPSLSLDPFKNWNNHFLLTRIYASKCSTKMSNSLWKNSAYRTESVL